MKRTNLQEQGNLPIKKLERDGKTCNVKQRIIDYPRLQRVDGFVEVTMRLVHASLKRTLIDKYLQGLVFQRH